VHRRNVVLGVEFDEARTELAQARLQASASPRSFNSGLLQYHRRQGRGLDLWPSRCKNLTYSRTYGLFPKTFCNHPDLPTRPPFLNALFHGHLNRKHKELVH
jgi:hypothetical protein